MLLQEYIEKVRKAHSYEDDEEVRRLEEEYGNHQATYSEIEEATSHDVSTLIELMQDTQSLNDFLIDMMINLVELNNLEVPRELIDVINLRKEEEN